MNTWWGTLRSLFICNEFWHHPDAVLLGLLIKLYETAPQNEKKEWLNRLGSLNLVLNDGSLLPIQWSYLSRVQPSPRPTKTSSIRPNEIVAPFALRPSTPDAQIPSEYSETFRLVIKALARMRSFYNSGRMMENKVGRKVGPPPLVSMQYKRQCLGRGRYYDFASWNGSASPRPFADVIVHIDEIASEHTTYRIGIPDPRKYLHEDDSPPEVSLDLPSFCHRLTFLDEANPLQGYVVDEIVQAFDQIYVAFKTPPTFNQDPVAVT